MKKIFKFFGSKNFKFSTVALLMMLCAVIITVFINMIGERTNHTWDMTENKMYSIGEQTKTIAERLDKEVEIIFLADGEKIRGGTEIASWVWHFLQNYDKFPKVSVKFIDPDTNPEIVAELKLTDTIDINKYDIIVKSGEKFKKFSANSLFTETFTGLSFSGEQEVTSAILYVTSEITPTVYFLEGHKQRDLNSEYKLLRALLEINNFDVKRLDLNHVAEVPEDAKILFCASPKVDLSIDERDKLEKYLENGGNIIFLFDPVASNSRFTNFEHILEKYDLSLYYDKVKEGNEMRHLVDMPYHILPILSGTRLFSDPAFANFQVLMPESRSINLLRNDPEGVVVTPLLTASGSAEREPFGNVETEEDLQGGPIDVAVLSEYNGENESKVLVIGNAYFITDDALERYARYYQNNLLFITQCIATVYENTSDVYIMPKTSFLDTITVNSSNAQKITGIIIFGLPLLVIVSGIAIWLRRRRL